MADPQKQTFTNVAPIQQQQTFSNVTPIDGAQPSAISRFASNAASGAGVMPEEDAENFFKHPIDTLGRMANAQGELGARAGREIKSGDLVRGLTHGAEFLLPGVGPNLAKSGDQLESGDYAGGAGTMVGTAFPFVLGSPEARAAGASALEPVRGIASKGLSAVSDSVNPDLTGLFSPRLAHAQRLAGTISKAIAPAESDAAVTSIAKADPTTGLWPPGSQTPGALADIPARSAMPASQTGEALGTAKSGQLAASMKDPGAPLPEKPDPQLLQARSLFEGASSPPDPAAGLGKIPVAPAQAGQLAASIQQPSAEVAPGFKRGSLQDLLDKSLGAKKLDPKVPLRQQMPATSGVGVSTVPTDAAASSSSAEPEHMGQFARANGLELHQAIPETVDGDVLRAKIHDMTNVQVRQLAINSGVDMGQMPVTNAKNAGGVTRQQALKWIMMNHTPEEIGDMIDQGQHLPASPSGAISGALVGNRK